MNAQLDPFALLQLELSAGAEYAYQLRRLNMSEGVERQGIQVEYERALNAFLRACRENGREKPKPASQRWHVPCPYCQCVFPA